MKQGIFEKKLFLVQYHLNTLKIRRSRMKDFQEGIHRATKS